MAIGDFTDQAEAYHRSRPTYPAAMLDDLQARLSLGPGDAVADIGAGTGILTGLLAARGYAVSAIEPNAAMRAHATADDRVDWIDGTFEATGLADASQDWCVAAQAFHWADPPRALPELARVLKAGRALTVLFNDRDHTQSELMTNVWGVIRRVVPEFDEAYRDRDWGHELCAGGFFGDVWYHEVPHVVVMSRARFLELWRGHNRLNNIAGPERFEALFSEIAGYLDDGAHDEVPVAYRARAWTAWRLPRRPETDISTG